MYIWNSEELIAVVFRVHRTDLATNERNTTVMVLF
jgi:hypothetical protein